MSLKAAIGIVENALNYRVVSATGCCVVPVGDLETLNRILADLIPLPKIEKRWLRVFDMGAGYFQDSEKVCHDAQPRIGILCFTFKDGKPDTTVAPEWVK